MKKMLLMLSLIFCIQNVVAEEVPFVNEDDQKVCEGINPGELESYTKIINRFDNQVVSSKGLKRNQAGLQSYLDQTGVRYFSANELMTPNSETDALKCGLQNLIPHQCIWASGAAILSIFDKIRELIGAPITFRNWWRPSCYNELVAGAKASDHLMAKSMDIDFKTPHDRAVAQKFICQELWKKGENVQVGIGCNSLHIGLGSPRGKRFWVYGSYASCPVKSLDNCWDI